MNIGLRPVENSSENLQQYKNMSKVDPQVSEFYQHRYGGIYIVRGISTSTVDKSNVVVYDHIYPFEYQMYHRPYDEWCDGRFMQLNAAEVKDLLAKDRKTFQEEITAAMLASKA